MANKISLSSGGTEELFSPPTLKEMCIYKCLTNKEILTKEVEVADCSDKNDEIEWGKYRLKEPIQKDLVEVLLDAEDEYLFRLTANYMPLLAAIRMCQPHHLIKVHVSNTFNLTDSQLEFLLSGCNVKSLDINGCLSLGSGARLAINRFGQKLEYLRVGRCRIFSSAFDSKSKASILKTPNLKTFIFSYNCFNLEANSCWNRLVKDFIGNLNKLQLNRIGEFTSLEFLEPAKDNLTSLTLSHCAVTQSAKAWESLFKLGKLKTLDLIGTPIGAGFSGEYVVQRLLTCLPSLTSLAVDPGLLKNTIVGSSTRGQGTVPRRLEFLGVVDNEADVLRKAKLLAKDVAYFGSVEGELRILDYYSSRLTSTLCDSTLSKLLDDMSDDAEAWDLVTVIHLMLKTVKHSGTTAIFPVKFFRIFTELLTENVVGKLGEVMLDQCIDSISAFLDKMNQQPGDSLPEAIFGAVDIMSKLERNLRLKHYVLVVPTVMQMTEMAVRMMVFTVIGTTKFRLLLQGVAQLLEKTGNRFPDDVNESWGLSSVLKVIKEFRNIMRIKRDRKRGSLLKVFGSMIQSVQKLCFSSSHCRDTFQFEGGINVLMELLDEINNDGISLLQPEGLILKDIVVKFIQNAERDY